MLKAIPYLFITVSTLSLGTLGAVEESATPTASPVVAPTTAPQTPVPTTPVSTTAPTATPQATTQAQPATSFAPFTGKAKGDKVRMRLQADLDSSIIKELNKDEMMLVVGEKDNFYEVMPPRGTKGFVFRTFVLDNVIEGTRVNIRLSPDLSSPIIAQLNTGDRVKGSLLADNARWMEIEPPQTTRFYVAKDFVSKAGGTEMIADTELRRSEVDRLLNTAYLTSQSELRKPFEEIDMDRLSKNFQRISSEYSDFPDQVAKSQQVLAMVQDAYTQKKVTFLESKTANLGWEARHTDREMTNDKEQLAEAEETPAASPSGKGTEATDNSPAGKESSGETQLATENKTQTTQQMTDKMRVWEPVEEALFSNWQANMGEGKIEDFYLQQKQEAVTLTGIVESYTRPVKNRPGDYLLKVDNLPIAFLYSTKVNLDDKIGQRVTISAVPRSNNNFAFPAYYVLSVE